MSKIYGLFENVDVEGHMKLVILALIKKAGGEITLTIDEIKSISIDSEIEETINDDATLTLKELSVK